MTGAGQTPPPGWYPDPSGAPGMVRWWSGETWSDVMMPSGPGVSVGTVPGAPAQRPAEPAAEQPSEGPARRPGPSRAWTAAVAVVVLVAAVVGTLLAVRSGDDGPDRSASPPSSGGLPDPPSGAGPGFPPGTVRIIDEAAGISYPYLGEGWSEFDLGLQLETTETAGQYFTTQEDTPDGGIFISQCTSGPVEPQYGDAADLRSTVTTLAASVRANYYPGPNEREVLRDEARTVDGHRAHLYEFSLSWDIEGYDATGERAALLLVDVGRPAPALLYISIPNSHAELYGVINRVLDAVDVL
ncbi:DUF2510 domain-containing protein [Blastococcus sp. TF02A-35]|uniref:DUF2510 domain-containing protein n=1 Tax=Blastococcus sp. TF02A-35 TaxID=2559612 RepID=UPI0010738140|nr:DUF2510 domain-containing protein [Blastococcus sp. TF02A_35]TFV52328.1 DUF2510 domain-containing protein [Blastococcus sp. TF02A_35]